MYRWVQIGSINAVCRGLSTATNGAGYLQLTVVVATSDKGFGVHASVAAWWTSGLRNGRFVFCIKSSFATRIDWVTGVFIAVTRPRTTNGVFGFWMLVSVLLLIDFLLLINFFFFHDEKFEVWKNWLMTQPAGILMCAIRSISFAASAVAVLDLTHCFKRVLFQQSLLFFLPFMIGRVFWSAVFFSSTHMFINKVEKTVPFAPYSSGKRKPFLTLVFAPVFSGSFL